MKINSFNKIHNNYEVMYNNIIENWEIYLYENPKIESMIIGISGGIDSAIVAVLARQVIDKMNREIKLIGYSLPLISNQEDETNRAILIGNETCDDFEVINKTSETIQFICSIDEESFFDGIYNQEKLSMANKIRIGNIKARTRMIYLYDKAQKYKGMVLSTDNYTEYLLGFWTLHGDVGDFGPIQGLWKTEVYGLAKWMAKNNSQLFSLSRCIDSKPTDGLGIADNDLDQILSEWKGSYIDGYRKVDETLIDYLDMNKRFERNNPVIKRHLDTSFKRKNPVNIHRTKLIQSF